MNHWASISEEGIWSSEETRPCGFKVVFAFSHTVVVGFRFVRKPPMIDVRLEAVIHWLRYGRCAPRSVREMQWRNPGSMDRVIGLSSVCAMPETST